jgi:cytochrome b pre-mRNA-processing protein 3
VGWLARLLGRDDDGALLPLYHAVVAEGRAPHWYVEGQVPDSVDGRFDMIAAILSMVLLRLEAEPAGTASSVRLTERFVDDMDGQLRQIGIGDITVGKHMGRMMSMLGGRLGAYRDGLAAGDLAPALARNLYRGDPPGEAAVRHVADRLTGFKARLDALPLDAVIDGRLA